MVTPGTRNHCQLNLSPLMTEILKPSDLAWLQLLRPHRQTWSLAHRQTPGSTHPMWPSLTNNRASQTLCHGGAKGSVGQLGRDHGAVWGSQLCAQPTFSPARTQLAAKPGSLPNTPAILFLCRGAMVGLGHPSQVELAAAAARRAAHPTAGTRHILEKLRQLQFSKCPSPAAQEPT